MHSQLISSQSQMKFLKFYLWHSSYYKLHLTTVNLSKDLHQGSMSTVEVQRIAQLSIWKRTDFESLPKYAYREGI